MNFVTATWLGILTTVFILKAIWKRFFRLLFLVVILWVYTNANFRISDENAIREFNKLGIALKTDNYNHQNHRIHYVWAGNDSAASLVFLHGTPGSWYDFEAFMKDSELLQQAKLVSIDRPGLGYSDFGEALPMQQQVSAIAELLKKIKNNRPMYLAGHSLGAPVAAWLAAENPDLVQGIFILCGSLSPELEPTESWRYLAAYRPFTYLLPGAFRPSNQELVYFKKDIYELEKKLSQVVCPIYIAHAVNDMFVPIGNVAYMCNHFSNADFVSDTILPDGNHFLPFNRVPLMKQIMMTMMDG